MTGKRGRPKKKVDDDSAIKKDAERENRAPITKITPGNTENGQNGTDLDEKEADLFKFLPKKDLFRVDEVASYLSVHSNTIRNMIDHGRIDVVKNERVILVPRTSIISFVRKNKIERRLNL